jgi:hypothetical protein
LKEREQAGMENSWKEKRRTETWPTAWVFPVETVIGTHGFREGQQKREEEKKRGGMFTG